MQKQNSNVDLMGFVPQTNAQAKKAGMGGSMSPIRKSFADPRYHVFKNDE
jgi:hypothetical protein|tara:strand:+ start:700 stop:849 length:150 start_codon:yes stop_codon:yes gene_type:complete